MLHQTSIVHKKNKNHNQLCMLKYRLFIQNKSKIDQFWRILTNMGFFTNLFKRIVMTGSKR